MEKSTPQFGDVPNWYRKYDWNKLLKGKYFGSRASRKQGEFYVTHDRKDIISVPGEFDPVAVLQNICAHQGAELCNTPGYLDIQHGLRCKVHKWKYDEKGTLVAAPRFKACRGISLATQEAGEWNGMFLGHNQDILLSLSHAFGKEIGLPRWAFDIRNFVFCEERTYALPYHPALMFVNYFDGLHVPLVHQKTFALVADCNTYQWEFSGLDSECGYSIQQVMSHQDVGDRLGRIKAVTKAREPQRSGGMLSLFHEIVKDASADRSEFGWADLHLWLREVFPKAKTPIPENVFAVWAAIYGNGFLMPELYEGGRFLAVSYLVREQRGLDYVYHNVVEYYMHRSLLGEHWETARRKFITAYEASAREDDTICETLWRGHQRDDLVKKRIFHEGLECGEAHFHTWANKNVPQIE